MDNDIKYLNVIKDLLDDGISCANSETAFGEPQTWLYLPNGRSLELTHEENGLQPNEQYFSWRVHCSEDEFDDDKYHSTMGIIDQRVSNDFNSDTVINNLRWAFHVASQI